MSNWEMVRLGDIAQNKLEYGSGASAIEFNNKIRYIRITDIDESGKLNRDKVSPSEFDEKYLLNEGDILFARSGATVGKTYIHMKNDEKSIYAGYLIRCVPNKEMVVPQYVYYYTKSPRYLDFIKLTQRAVAQPNINAKQYSEMLIPVYPLDIQKNITDIMDKTQEIIDCHKKQLEELDNLIKSVFYDMFGDPITNEKGWEVKKLFDVCFKITDGTHDTPIRYEQGVLFITGKNIRPFNIDLTEVEYVSREDHDIIYKRCNPEYKDVLYTNIGVNYGTAAMNIFDFEFSMKNVALLKYNRDLLNGEYLQCYLNYKRGYITSQNKTGGAQTFMALNTIKQLEIMCPTLTLQQKFAEIVTNIEEQKAITKRSIAESQNLFNGLMNKYFE